MPRPYAPCSHLPCLTRFVNFNQRAGSWSEEVGGPHFQVRAGRHTLQSSPSSAQTTSPCSAAQCAL